MRRSKPLTTSSRLSAAARDRSRSICIRVTSSIRLGRTIAARVGGGTPWSRLSADTYLPCAGEALPSCASRAGSSSAFGVAAGLAVEAHDVKPGLIYQDSSVKVTAFPVSHGELLAYGYRFQTPDRTVVISGDTSPSPALINSCQKCDVLIHEAFSEDYMPADMPNWLQYRQKYHTTPTQLAEIANQTQPGLLIVYHRGVGVPGREISDEQYLAEIRRTYRGRVVIGQDLDVY